MPTPRAIRARRYKVVVDAVNSVGGIVMPELLRRLGCEVVELNCDPTGEFAHNPEPLPENLTEIAGVIRREKADLGIVVDPDVDRLALVTRTARCSSRSTRWWLWPTTSSRSTRAGTPYSTQLVAGAARRDGAARRQILCSAVGEVNVVARMKEVGAVIGGEGNGGVDSPGAALRARCAGGNGTLFDMARTDGDDQQTQLRATYPAYYASKNKSS